MKNVYMTIILVAAAVAARGEGIGETSVTKWPGGKRGAVSITYDDGSLNQFRIAVPIMDRLGLPGTFYINTGRIPGGSTWTGRHIGRSWQEIAAEVRTVPTDAENVFERASAMRFMPFRGAGNTFTTAGIEIDAGRMNEGIKIINDFYVKLNAGELEAAPVREGERRSQEGELTWDLARELTARGHEFSSHMVTHPYMSALDAPNIIYELEAGRDEIRRQLGVRSTLVGEMPYDTEVERAFELMLPIFPVARSRPWFRYTMELHQPGWSSMTDPEREYVQMRQTVYTRTTLEELNGWVDRAAAHDNIWLVTIHHGIDGIGWEAQKSRDVAAHFRHIAAQRDKLWVATFGDAARYVKERLSAVVTARVCSEEGCPCGCDCGGQCGAIVVTVDHPLDKTLFDLPLTMKTYVDPAWEEATVTQGTEIAVRPVQRDDHGTFVMYDAIPGGGEISLKRK